LDAVRREANSLEALADDAAALPAGDGDASAASAPPVSLREVVEEFTALRHELKLQTKSSRGLQEQAELALAALRTASEQMRSAAADEARAAERAARPFVEALAELDEALRRGRKAIDNSRRRLVDDPATRLHAALDDRFRRQPAWKRPFVRPFRDAVREMLDGHFRDAGQMFDALLQGYDLVISRLQRTLDAEHIGRVECLGRPVDPHRMTVVEVVDASAQPPGQVVEEVRPGYVWRDKVIRYAEVKAARSAP
jgi:molecular chaperone GrpE